MIERGFVQFHGVRLHLEHDALFAGDVVLIGEDERGRQRTLVRFNSGTGKMDLRPHNGLLPLGETE